MNAAPTGSTLQVGPGAYAPFAVTTPNLSLIGSGPNTVVLGHAGVADTIAVRATGTSIQRLSVRGCTPANVANDLYEWFGSSNIGVYSSATTITNVQITGTPHLNNEHLNFGCYGIAARNVNQLRVQSSTITGNGYGIFLLRGGSATVIANNSIHDNTSMIRNTRRPGDDYGAVAVGVDETNPTTSTQITGNTIYNNAAPSHDYITDGGAFEVFQAANVTFNKNTIYNNESVLETGSGTHGTCAHITFTNNTATGRTPQSHLTQSGGILLRCAQQSTFTDNTLTDFTGAAVVFDFEPGQQSMNELSLADNVITQQADPAYFFMLSPVGQNVTIQQNRYLLGGPFAVDWHNDALHAQADFQRVTGMQG